MRTRSSQSKDYYQILGISPDAAEEDIKRAYRRLALEWHPDRNPDNPNATERFQEISEAYAVLIDPVKRRQYDLSRQPGSTERFTYSRDDLFRDMFSNPSAFAIFEEIAREFERMGMHVDRHYFQRELFGGRTVITGGVFVVSPFSPFLALFRLARAALRQPASKGTLEPGAAQPSILGRLTHWLLGAPQLPAATREGITADLLTIELEADEAARGVQKKVLVAMNGAPRQLLVNIPPGVRTGTRLRLRSQGESSAADPSGEIQLKILVRKNRSD
ncbi:MAG: DnaJ domain-containing protein [Acidobacteria bacterium]|nr:DnaJ domain-containing protein [Acidobacteriota bacterium]